MVYNHQQSEDFITLTHFSKLELPSSTLSLTSINTASSPLAEALDFRFLQDLGEEGNLGAMLAGFTGPAWEKQKDVLFSKFRSRGFHTMLMNQSHPAGSSSPDSEPQIDCGMGVKMVNQALATSRCTERSLQFRTRVATQPTASLC